jgi:hypothetical protein
MAHRYTVLNPKNPGFLKIKTQNPFRLGQESGFLPTLKILGTPRNFKSVQILRVGIPKSFLFLVLLDLRLTPSFRRRRLHVVVWLMKY